MGSIWGGSGRHGLELGVPGAEVVFGGGLLTAAYACLRCLRLIIPLTLYREVLVIMSKQE